MAVPKKTEREERETRGRKRALTPSQEIGVVDGISKGLTVRVLAKAFDVGVGTIQRIKARLGAAHLGRTGSSSKITRNSKPSPKQAQTAQGDNLSGVDTPPTGRVWKGETPNKSPDGSLLDWKGPKIPPTEYNWIKTFFFYDHDMYTPFFELGDVHEEICNLLETLGPGDILQELMSRDHLKTTIIDEADTCYIICERRDVAMKGVLLISGDDDLAAFSYNSIIEHMTRNPLILDFYGGLIDQKKVSKLIKKRQFSAKTAFFTFQPPGSKPGLRCTSFKSGGITGWHPGVAKLDDIEDEPLSEAYMNKFQKVIFKKLMGAISKTGYIIITGTIKGFSAENDIYLMLETNEDVMTYRYPAVVSTEDHITSAFPPMDDITFHQETRPRKSQRSGKIMLGRNGLPLTTRVRIIDSIKDEAQYEITWPEKFDLKELVLLRMKYRYGEVKIKTGKTKRLSTDDDFFSEFQLEASNPSGKVFDMSRVFTTVPVLMNERRFMNFSDLTNFLHAASIPIYMFVDPGGKDSHGISWLVMALISAERWGPPVRVVLDCGIERDDMNIVAIKLARVIEQWNVSSWGIEGNFDQLNTYAFAMPRFMQQHYDKIGYSARYKSPQICTNTIDKFMRINTNISNAIGYIEQPPMFFVNPECESFERFVRTELQGFGFQLTAKDKHEYDISDCLASIMLHMEGGDGGDVGGWSVAPAGDMALGV